MYYACSPRLASPRLASPRIDTGLQGCARLHQWCRCHTRISSPSAWPYFPACHIWCASHTRPLVPTRRSLCVQALPKKHRWVRTIHKSVQRLRDMHLSTSFVAHSLRPAANDPAGVPPSTSPSAIGMSESFDTPSAYDDEPSCLDTAPLRTLPQIATAATADATITTVAPLKTRAAASKPTSLSTSVSLPVLSRGRA